MVLILYLIKICRTLKPLLRPRWLELESALSYRIRLGSIEVCGLVGLNLRWCLTPGPYRHGMARRCCLQSL